MAVAFTNVISIFSSLITIFGATVDTCSTVQGEIVSETAFKQQAERLLELQFILQRCHAYLESNQSQLPAETPKLIVDAFNECTDKAETLKLIFNRTISDGKDVSRERFLKAVQRVGKGNTVEGLIEFISRKTQLVLDYHLVQGAVPDVRQRLDALLQRMQSLEVSPPNNATNTFNNHRGPMYANTGTGQMLFGRSRYNNYNYGEHYHYYDQCENYLEEQFLLSLKYSEMNARVNEIKPHEKKTFEWVFKTPDSAKGSAAHGNSRLPRQSKPSISNWFRSGNGIYLVLGKPGSGKSTFMKFLYEDKRIRGLLRQWSGESEINVLFHSFWGLSKESAAQNWKGLLANMITQLVPLESQAISDIVEKTQHKTNYNDWSLLDLEKVFMAIVRSSKHRYCLLIDGLDEVETTGQIQDILKWIRKVSSYADGKCKICLATRPTPYTEKLNHVDSMKIQEYTTGDIQMHVNRRLRMSEGLAPHRSDPQMDTKLCDLITAICDKAQGVWIWVYHVLMLIEESFPMESDLSRLRARVDHLPEELNELYRQSLSTSRRKWPGCEEQRYRILSCGHRFPLPLFQLAIAVDDEMRHQYLQACSSREESTLARECEIFRKSLYRTTGCLVESYQDPAFEESAFRWVSMETPAIDKLSTKVTLDSDLAKTFAEFQRYWQKEPWRIERVRFIHRTVHEFLVEEGETLSQLTFQMQRILAESMLVCYMEDVHALTVTSIQQLCESLDGIKGDDAKVILTVDQICQSIVESRRYSLPETETELLPDLGDGKWLHLLITAHTNEYQDFSGLLFACGSMTAATYVLKRYGSKWSSYYKGYLALCAIRAFEIGNRNIHPLKTILPLLIDGGADLDARFSSPGDNRVRPSTTPDVFRTESCISRLLTMTVVELLYFTRDFSAGLEEGDLVLSNAGWVLQFLANYHLDTITTTFFTFVDDDTDSMVVDTWWGPSEPEDHWTDEENPCSDADNKRDWLENGTVVVSRGHEFWNVLKDMMQKHGRELLRSKAAKEDFLQRCVMLFPISYLSVLEKATQKLVWIQCPDSQIRPFTEAMLFGKKDDYIRLGRRIVEVEGRRITADDHSVSVHDVALDAPWNTPQIPLDPSRSIVGNRWQEVCTLRKYYADLRLEQSDASSMQEFDPVYWEVYQ